MGSKNKTIQVADTSTPEGVNGDWLELTSEVDDASVVDEAQVESVPLASGKKGKLNHIKKRKAALKAAYVKQLRDLLRQERKHNSDIKREQEAKAAELRRRLTRAKIILGGWIARNDPSQLQAALMTEAQPDLQADLQFLSDWMRAGKSIDD